MDSKQISLEQALEMGFVHGASITGPGESAYFELKDLEPGESAVVLKTTPVYPSLKTDDLIDSISERIYEDAHDEFGEITAGNYLFEDIISNHAGLLDEFVQAVNNSIVNENTPSYECSEYVATKEPKEG